MAVPELSDISELPEQTATENGGKTPNNESASSASDHHGDKTRATWSGKVEFMLSAVGYAVGLGNVWRFPHLCYTNGGGAFLIPYVLMLALVGLPLFFLELAFGQYASLGPITIWRICPLFKGLGYAMVLVSMLVSIYYNVILGYTVFYFFASFQSEVPWATCDHWWNTPACTNNKYANVSDNATLPVSTAPTTSVDLTGSSTALPVTVPRSPAQEFWEFRVLGMEEGIDIANIGDVRWHVTLCLLLSWVVVFFCIMKGIKSSGKVVYFTATFPYVILFVLFIRGVTLEGAGEGIKYYLKPNFTVMADVKVWNDAAVQILYSLGPGFGSLLTMGSYNKFSNNCHRDAITVAAINCGTSVFAGFVIFSVLGHMALEAGVSVDLVVDKGPGLAFVAYPQGLALMPAAPFWSILFFFMLFTLGLDSQFVGMECIVTGLTDEFPKLYKHKLYVTLGLCGLLFLCGLPCATQGGMYVIELMDKFSTSFPLLFIVMLETIVINWIYGFKRFMTDVESMIGFRPNYYWMACWVVLTPLVLAFILVFTCVEYDGIEYNGDRYPTWAEGVGWFLSLTSIVMIPGWMLAKVIERLRTWQGCVWLFRSPRVVRTLELRDLVRPSPSWGPALREDRQRLQAERQARTEDEGDSLKVVYKDDKCIIVDAALYSGDSYI